jgi:type III secretion protein U
MSEKTQKPTPRKLREARKRGEVVRSRELTSLAAFVALWICLGTGAGFGWKHLSHIVERAVLSPQTATGPQSEGWLAQAQGLFTDAAWILLPLLGVGMFGAVLIGALQTRGVVSVTPITPKFERINPAQGLKNLFSTRQLLDLAKMLVKTTLLLALLSYCLVTALDPFVKTIYAPAGDLARIAGTFIWRLMGWAALIYAVGAVLDYAHQFYEFMKQQKMSLEEVRREYRDTEGDPHIRRRRRALAREAIFNRALRSLSSASVVVVNPTHFAVALQYLPGTTPLPRVVAKGSGALALQLRAQAERDGVPVLEDPPLARRLFREVPVDHYINTELIDPVAAVLRWVRLMEERRDGSVRLALAETEADTPHRVDQPGEVGPVDLPAQAGNVNVDDVVERGGSANIFPDLMR